MRYRLLKIEASDEVRMERIEVDQLPTDWPEKLEATRAIGDGWLSRASSALIKAPSAIAPHTFNVLLNPAHQDAVRIGIVESGEYVIDPRLLK